MKLWIFEIEIDVEVRDAHADHDDHGCGDNGMPHGDGGCDDLKMFWCDHDDTGTGANTTLNDTGDGESSLMAPLFLKLR